ncbi:Uncharacterised protein [Mycobacteroides abscessus subsp. abscessus]|nr:Uncharacterised protein [Mycobacteroides abscessus subsp. abscessus]
MESTSAQPITDTYAPRTATDRILHTPTRQNHNKTGTHLYGPVGAASLGLSRPQSDPTARLLTGKPWPMNANENSQRATPQLV